MPSDDPPINGKLRPATYISKFTLYIFYKQTKETFFSTSKMLNFLFLHSGIIFYGNFIAFDYFCIA